MASNLRGFQPQVIDDSGIILIDPNPGEDGGGEQFQPQENYAIFVELKTYKRSRQKIINTGDDLELESNQEAGQKTVINFIDGSENATSDRHLTTHYTELRTSFEEGQEDLGTLGISSIDIEFNTSYTPMITINFVDVRGRMLEEGNDSKYNIFFNLPYPLFELTVKGYYGPPISYCLHLTKFKSKFNSDTGSFEITTNFVGYTYAFLADTLLGYVRAIGETEIGQDKLLDKELTFDISLKEEESSFDRPNTRVPITINEFLRRTTSINSFIKKLKQDDAQLKQYKKADSTINDLASLIEDIKSFKNKIKGVDGGDNINVIDTRNVLIFPNKANKDVSNLKEKYDTNILDTINELNGDGQSGGGGISGKYKISTDDIEPYVISSTVRDIYNNNKFASDSDRNYVREILENNYDDPQNNDSNVVLVDFKIIIDRVNESRNKLQEDSTSALDQISKRLQDQIQDEDILGFKPTIANIIEIFSKNVEAFIESIESTAQEAQSNINNSERRQLDDNEAFYPFPDYKEKNVDNGGAFEKAWIGNEFPDIEEVGFVESLIDGLLDTKKKDKNRARNMRLDNLAWHPIHPLDLKGTISDRNPWDLGSNLTNNDFIRLLNIRASTFLFSCVKGVELDTSEIELMAKLEARNAFNNISNDLIKNVISNKSINEIKLGEFFESFQGTITTKAEPLKQDNVTVKNMNEPLPPSAKQEIEDDFNGVPSNIRVSVDVESDADISIFDREEYVNDLGGSLPVYDDNIESSLDELSGGFIDLYRNNLSEPSDLEKTKFFNRKKANTDFTITIPNQGFNVTDNGRNRIPTYHLFYDPDVSSPIKVDWQIPFVTDSRTLEYYEIIFNRGDNVDFRIGRNSDTLDNSVIRNDFNNEEDYEVLVPHKVSNQKHILFESRDETELSLKPGRIQRNLNYEEDKMNVPFIGYSEFNWHYNIFGTHLYYSQNRSSEPDKSKAFLFLNSIPFRGHTLPSLEDDPNRYGPNNELLASNVFGDKGLFNLFGSRPSFVSVPYSWILYIGSLIWRAEKFDNGDPIILENTDSNGNSYNLLPVRLPIQEEHDYRERYMGLTEEERKKNLLLFNFTRLVQFDDYSYDIGISDILKLPKNVKETFYNEFDQWTRSGWLSIKSKFQIFTDDVTDDDIFNFWRDFTDVRELGIYYKNPDELTRSKHPKLIVENINKNYSLAFTDLKFVDNEGNTDSTIINPTVNFLDNSISPSSYEATIQSDSDINGSVFNFFLEISDDDELIRNFLTEEKVILNPTYKIWYDDDKESSIDQTGIDLYFRTFLNEFSNLKTEEEKNTDKNERQELKKEIFNTLDNEDIKISVYDDIKNIYDKWVAGIEEGDTSASLSCGNFTDDLFESFRFLDRSFNDMSNKLLINPVSIVDYLENNFNKSFYNFLSRILSDNNMDFIPLPNYINFKTKEGARKVFTPYLYDSEKAFNEDERNGPTFICMYIGERSNSLDLGDNSEYLNDGFDIRVDEDGGGIKSEDLPEDFNDRSGEEQNKVPVIMVNYGAQDQSVFKDFDLDQSEFTETNESLIVQENISKRGAPTNKNMQGQNLYDIYQKRAYHCEINTMGAPYIQPLMYFQLNNIPMFHGVYTIIKVNHSIKPNHMSTSFQGVRLGRIKTPFVQNETVFMNLIGSLSDIDIEDDVQLGSELREGTAEGITNPLDDEDIASAAESDNEDILIGEVVQRVN